MFRIIAALVVSLAAPLFIGMGLSQGQPKEGKDAKGMAKVPTIERILEVDTFKEDLKVVRERGFKGDGPDLIAYFRERTLKQPDPKEIASLVKQLGDEDFPTRETAYIKLASLGAAALAGLKEGENDSSLEIRKRVGELKMRIDTKAEPTLQVAAVRVLARVKSDGTADALMTFLPFVSDTSVVDEICKTLGAVAVRDGKPDPLLVKALGDSIAVKRGAAGEALVRGGAKDEIPGVKKLLKDADVSVRYRIAMAMLSSQDKEILPVLIDLLADLDPAKVWRIEDALFRVAGDKAPNVGVGNDPASRKACRDAWAKWLADNEKTLDMTLLRPDNLYLDRTLIVQLNNRIGVGFKGNTGEVYEIDANKKVLWKIEMPNGGYPVDAQMINGNRVLIAEWQAGRITERDTKGDIKWEHNCGGNPFQVQRLANGNTFYAMTSRLVEVDRNHKEVWTMQRPQNDLIRARKLPSGEVVYITNTNQGNNQSNPLTRLDPVMQKTKSFNVAPVQVQFGCMDVLANGNVLVSHFGQNRVIEYDPNGAQVATFQVQLPNSVVRLPNGNTLVASQNTRTVTEFDRDRNQVATYQCDGMAFIARRR